MAGRTPFGWIPEFLREEFLKEVLKKKNGCDIEKEAFAAHLKSTKMSVS